MGLGNTPYQYMETEEYADLKKSSLVILSRYLLPANGPLSKAKSTFLLFHTERSD